MTHPNQHVTEYLDYYCSMDSAPEFAVLLTGEWGSGKTWFINKHFKENSIKPIYVSLYGITSFTEIEDEFFRQLHPKLSSKGAKLAGKVFKGLLKATIRVDLDSDGKQESAINSQIPDINLPDYLTNIDKRVLIFDDLERCKIELSNILGYINYFVEYQGLKAIILAHEDKLLKNDGCNDSYKEIKEKLIGKTLLIVPDLDSAIDDFIGKVTDLAAKEFLTQNHLLIAETYNLTCFKNLRILKQSLWDFERIYKVLPEKATSIPELVKKILRLCLIFSLEVRIGQLPAKDIIHINQSRFLYNPLASNKEAPKDKTPKQKFIEKYSVLNTWEPIPEVTFWSEYLEKGTINKEIMNASIDNSAFFLDESPANWVKLWHYPDLTDEIFENTLKIVADEFNRGDYKEIGVIKHTIGLFLQLSAIGLYSPQKESIIKSAKTVIESIKVDLSSNKVDDISYGGLGFHGTELAEFIEFSDYLKQIRQEVKQLKLPSQAKALMSIMSSDPIMFSQAIFESNTDDQNYADVPILIHIKASEFVEILIKLEPEKRRKINYALEERYKYQTNNLKLIDELNWLKEVTKLTKNYSKAHSSQPSGYALGIFSASIKNIMDRMDRLTKPIPNN